MLLKAFITQFGVLGDEFLTHFPRPFLLEEGRLLQLEEDEDTNPATRQVYYLSEAESPTVIGRKAPADLQLHDPNVSRQHARLHPPVEDDPHWRIEDLGASNGTFLNGVQLEPNKPKLLRDETVIGFGPILSLVFLEPQTFLTHLRRLATKQGLTEKPGEYLESGTEVGDAVALPDVSGSDGEAGASQDQLTLECPPFDPVVLEVGKRFVIGRSGLNADMVLPHPQISRRHAEIEVREEGVFVRDMRSANGTILGQAKLGTEFVEAPIGLAIKIADFRLVVRGPLGDVGGKTTVVPAARKKRKLLKGDLSKLSLGDMLVGIEEKQKSGSMRVDGATVGGQIHFTAGRPVRATTDDGRAGEEAVLALLKETAGTFEIDTTPKDFGPSKITRNFSDFVLSDFFDSGDFEA